MIVGVPKEIMEEENRVAITPAGVSTLVANGHKVIVEHNAGVGSGIVDEAYIHAGAHVLPTSQEVWESADLILKVKEPLPREYPFLRQDQIVFTYLHLAAHKELTLTLMEKKVVAIAYETIQLSNGSLPLLMPMSEVAGKLSIQKGAFCLEAKNGGSGILLSGVSGVPPAKVAILGAGVSGSNACYVAASMGARVSVIDINPIRLSYIQDIMHGHVTTIMSNMANIEEEVVGADLIIGAVLIPGAKAPRLITRDLVKRMKPGSAFIDIAVDQGGCSETTRPTTHNDPIYIVDDVVHYCVANMPGAVPRTSTYALTNATLFYVLEMANKGFKQAMRENPALKKGLNVASGYVVCAPVAEVCSVDSLSADMLIS